MTEPLEIPDQPLARGLTFDERVTELRQITTWETAREIARFEYGLGGDVIFLSPEPETVPAEGNHHE